MEALGGGAVSYERGTPVHVQEHEMLRQQLQCLGYPGCKRQDKFSGRLDEVFGL